MIVYYVNLLALPMISNFLQYKETPMEKCPRTFLEQREKWGDGMKRIVEKKKDPVDRFGRGCLLSVLRQN